MGLPQNSMPTMCIKGIRNFCLAWIQKYILNQNWQLSWGRIHTSFMDFRETPDVWTILECIEFEELGGIIIVQILYAFYISGYFFSNKSICIYFKMFVFHFAFYGNNPNMHITEYTSIYWEIWVVCLALLWCHGELQHKHKMDIWRAPSHLNYIMRCHIYSIVCR